jgi:hypothetical protein
MNGKSIGFLRLKSHAPTSHEIAATPALATVTRIIDGWLLLEYACVFLPCKAALGESSGVTDGYIVPPDFYTAVLSIAAEENTFRQRAFVQPMASATLQFPYLDITTVQSRRRLAVLRRRASLLDGRGPDQDRDRTPVQDDGAESQRAFRLLGQLQHPPPGRGWKDS